MVVQCPYNSFPPSAPDDVNHGKNDHPHDIHEMPINGQYLDTFGVVGFYSSQQCESHYQKQCHETYDHVRSVQTNQRVEGGAKETAADGETVVVNQSLPFAARAEKKVGSQRNGCEPP